MLDALGVILGLLLVLRRLLRSVKHWGVWEVGRLERSLSDHVRRCCRRLLGHPHLWELRF